MSRKPIPPTIQAEVVIKSRRRCALCVYLDGNANERPGQIAHINGNRDDNRLDNLVWLCLEHHDKFDSKTSQTKNYTSLEVRTYRDKLYSQHAAAEYSPEDIQLVRSYLNRYGNMFAHLFQEYSELAFKIDHRVMDDLEEIRNFWHTSPLRSFNASVRDIQDEIANNVTGLLSIYEINMYDLVGDWIKFDNHRFPHQVLVQKRSEAKGYVDSIAALHEQLQQVAVQ